MSQPPCGASAARLGLVAGVTLLVFGLVLVFQQASQADAAVLSSQAVAGFQTTEKLKITLSLANPKDQELKGNLQIELLGPDGQSLGQAEQEVRQRESAAGYSFDLPATKLPPSKLTLRCRFGKEKVDVPLSRILVVKAHETALTSSQEFYAGSPATLQCDVHGVRSITDTIPLAGAEIHVRLRTKSGNVFVLADDRTGADGKAEPRFHVPDVPAGQYTLVVDTQSALGTEKLERNVQVKAGAKILLVTDKPLYQPGQLMHLRALALRPFDLKPVAGSDLIFEIEDPKGNKVFKRPQRTSEFGVAAIDFQLADEVNMGDYHVRAIIGDQQADKSVTVKRYVLPKFKSDLTADKRFYLPKETLHAELQTDYFFGKPVAQGKVKVTASTFDLQFRPFQTWEGKTDASGHAKFDIRLPDYFVGQPLQKGDASVRLEVKVTDTADHTETIERTYPVSDQPIRVSLIPEGGRLVPDMPNRIFAAAIYPDGSPASCKVNLWVGRQANGKPVATVQTNDAGLAELTLTPKANQLRQGPAEQRNIEMLGGQNPAVWGPKILFDLFAEATDSKGHAARVVAEVNSNPLGENLLLRLDKAIYQGGDRLQLDIRSSAGLPTVYLDVVKSGQTLLTRWLDVKNGQAAYKLDLPAEVFGTLEVHAYQTLSSGEIIRDSRVIYVQPREELKIAVQPDKTVYQPGDNGRIRFQVTDTAGNPTAAALGVLIVDEAVYALQEMQPGLEKVYFTLQEELLKPKAEVIYRPRDTLDTLVREPQLPADKQQIAQVLLTSVKPKVPAHWQVSPQFERRQKVEGQLQQIGWALLQYAATQQTPVEYDKAAQHWTFKHGILQDLVNAGYLNASMLKDPLGSPWDLEGLGRLEKDFTPDHLARAVTLSHMQTLFWVVVNYTNVNQAKYLKDGKWNLLESVLGEATQSQRLPDGYLKDGWGKAIRLVKRDAKFDHGTGCPQWDYHELVSAGPDGKFDTADDVRLGRSFNDWGAVQGWWSGGTFRPGHGPMFANGRFRRLGEVELLRAGAIRDGVEANQFMFGARMAGAGGAPPMLANLAMQDRPMPMKADRGAESKPGAGPGAGSGTAPITRIREFFPETMLWQPILITDDRGIADLPVPFADSITTWRLTASASSRGGALGGVTSPLRVFQDFFVDLDLPVSLTQNDEVAFPVAVYNYLKTPQTVKLELQQEPWFELVGGDLTRSLDLEPNQVTSVSFRIRARRIGFQPLTVKASGSKMSDAIKRTVEVVPDGTRVEKVVTDRLTGKVVQIVDIPPHAIPDASKILVKIYPGVFSQVLEGTEGMLRMPFG
jgi:hypothetical protein